MIIIFKQITKTILVQNRADDVITTQKVVTAANYTYGLTPS